MSKMYCCDCILYRINFYVLALRSYTTSLRKGNCLSLPANITFEILINCFRLFPRAKAMNMKKSRKWRQEYDWCRYTEIKFPRKLIKFTIAIIGFFSSDNPFSSISELIIKQEIHNEHISENGSASNNL